ncbi:MAG: hypothetical protein CMB49_04170 [Euryarchaeota archaeon]|nr:hypothetical protein [Euryarchaeota archaeon]
MSELILEIESLSIGFDSKLISNLDLKVYSGDIIALTGSSGLGKTTLLRTIAGLISPIDGVIRCNVSPRGGIGYIPQGLGLVRHASVYHNVDLGARAGVSPISDSGSIFNWGQRRRERVETALNNLGIIEKIDEPVRRLSGGQQRRVATARTLAQRPKLILADEFLSELDQKNVEKISQVFQELILETGAAMILVEHNIERAQRISNRLLRLEDGKLIELRGEDE